VEQTPSPDNLLSNDLDVTMNSNVENSLDNNMPTLDDLEYEEQLNLVRMYCQIDETEQATQIINNLLANSSLSAKVHQQIDNLKQELGL
jgi:Tfp pilus assembly protein FimV